MRFFPRLPTPFAYSNGVVIRTNGGSLTVDAANDTVSHYGYVEVLDVQAVDTIHSYHENGTAGFARLKQGHFVVESEGIVNVLYATGSKTAVKVDNNNGTIGKAYATVTETANIYNGDAQEGQSGNVTLEKYDAVITEAVVTAMNSESIVEELNKTESSAVKTAIEAAVESSTFRGEGTEESPYLISNANELIIFRNKINTVSTNDPILTSYFKLTNDVDISTESNWRPISETGTSGKTFSGHFDGNNKTISGLRITEGSYRGLFGYVSGATIENVKLVNAQVNGAERIGALVGKIQGSATIKNCSTDSQSSVIGNNSNTGGLIGEIATNGIVVNLISLNNNAKVENTKSDSSRAGGIVGQVTTGADVTITGCENHGKITTNNGYAGGIVSAYQSGSLTITNCANNGELSGDYTGNMLGWYTSVRSITISSETNEFDLNAIGRFDIATSSNVSLYGKTYFVNKRSEYNKYKGSVLSSDEQRFSDIFAPEIIGQSPVALWDRLIHFYKTAKQTNNAFNVYPENYWGVFDEEYVGFGEGWDQYLTQYNEAYPDATLTKDEFSSSSWRQNIVYLAPTAEGPAE